MTLSARRMRSLPVLALAVVLGGFTTRASALSFITDVSKERARELGIVVSSQPASNDDLWVKVEFKTTGALQGYRYSHLELTRDGKRLLQVELRPRKPAPDSPAENVQLDFYLDPAALPNTTVTVYAYNEPRSGTGYRLKMKDFLSPVPPQ